VASGRQGNSATRARSDSSSCASATLNQSLRAAEGPSRQRSAGSSVWALGPGTTLLTARLLPGTTASAVSDAVERLTKMKGFLISAVVGVVLLWRWRDNIQRYLNPQRHSVIVAGSQAEG
jgi:hypothetical protein